MSRHANVNLDWADGNHDFRLGLGELLELQEKTGVGPWELASRLLNSHCRVQDVRETIRLGLKGAGSKPEEFLPLVRRYVDDRPLEENRSVAYVIVMAALVGSKEEEPGKSVAVNQSLDQTQTGSSGSPQSMEQEQ